MPAFDHDNMYVIYNKEIIKKNNITYMLALNHYNVYVTYKNINNKKK